jgi:hypothetical protein
MAYQPATSGVREVVNRTCHEAAHGPVKVRLGTAWLAANVSEKEDTSALCPSGECGPLPAAGWPAGRPFAGGDRAPPAPIYGTRFLLAVRQNSREDYTGQLVEYLAG